MPTSKCFDAEGCSTFPDLEILFRQYGGDTAESSFPSFLETLLFDQPTQPSLRETEPAPRRHREVVARRAVARRPLADTVRH